MITALLFLLGAIVGSFINVLVLRYNTGRSLGGRSACATCRAPLCWYDLIPIGSFLVVRGTCRMCRATISPQYFFVELITAILFVAVGSSCLAGACLSDVSMPIPELLAGILLLTTLLMAIVVYDIRHLIIPEGLVWFFIALSFIPVLLSFSPSRFLAGVLAAFPFAFLWFVSRGRWMGFGDAKLALGMGWLLGGVGAAVAIGIGFFSGALVGGALLIGRFLFFHIPQCSRSRLVRSLARFTMKSEIPFAPFLVFGLFLVVIFRLDLLALAYVF